ncbi:MAG: VCBS repeat-containing protein [Spirosoma sp.]|jgi:hypothetical protein|uniref:FG-GAP-like repeat-containing protein n=1 Tax=unclassified Spirosoma TaxID=2621999 RepID=UPI00096412B0|nr:MULTISPECIES: FG-GAP-like repeat-containing protein [unclassified Spirosoma]MBN8826888.1 VCBS repeat-containing protein [Spirosoma sp.]OJW72937.1 MAG: hypothetical protein BGO59_09370 [Spirosoma sp. 48-14]
MKVFFFLCFLMIPGVSVAQSASPAFGFQYDLSPTVWVNGRNLRNPWVGGLNATQYATVRLNDDTRDDLVVFDRTTSKVTTFLATENPTGNGVVWQYAPEYESLFPAISSWLIMVDYDGDGRKDLFTLGGGATRAYRNVLQNGLISFQLTADPIMTIGFAGSQILYTGSTDLPAILDYDGDGDVDILSFDPTGNLIDYHQNMSVERTGKKEGLDFLRTSCQLWGHFLKEFCNDFTFGIQCDGSTILSKPSERGSRVKHAGNTMTILDVNGDGKKDMLFGFVSCTNIAVLYNSGTNDENANFTAFDSLYPAQNPVNFPAYAATFWEDVDGDGIKDLLASTFSDMNENYAYDFRASGWFYRNVGTNQLPSFRLVQKDFLQDTMLDLGESAAPALADLDGDGDQDLLIGYSGIRSGTTYRAGLWHFDNIGTIQRPAFTLVTTDYLGLTHSLGLSDVVPSFTDVDGNGSVDLVVTGTGRSAEIRVFLNAAPKGSAADYKSTNVTRWPNPGGQMIPGERITLFDVDRDGKVDLLVGKNDGTIQYYRNTGTTTNPVLLLQNQNFGGFTNDNSYYDRARSLVIADLNGDRKNELIAASTNGRIRIYQFPETVNQSLTLLDSLPSLLPPGKGLIATVADLDGDQLPDLMVGSVAGGVRYFKNTSQKILVTDLPEERIGPWAFPNPTDRFITVKPPYSGCLEIFSLTGQRMLVVQDVNASIETTVDLKGLIDGIYMLRLSSNNHATQIQKVLIQSN